VDEDDFYDRLRWQLEVEEEGVKTVEIEAAPKEAINEARGIRNRAATLLNSIGGPAIKGKKKINHGFVRRGNEGNR
jgi:hypothetical protein